jgi:hypothetical protein
LIRIADERLYRMKHTNHSRKGNGSPPATWRIMR